MVTLSSCFKYVRLPSRQLPRELKIDQKYNNDASRAIQEYFENPDVLKQAAVSLPTRPLRPWPNSKSRQQEVGMNLLHTIIPTYQVRLPLLYLQVTPS